MVNKTAKTHEEHEFFEKTRLRNFALVADGQKLWVSREVLAEHSPVFEKMFFGEFREAREGVEETELPNKKLNDVIEFLRVVMSTEAKSISSTLKPLC